MSTTSDILANHLASFGRGDLEALLSDYAPSAILFTSTGPLQGVDAIRPLFVGLFAEFGKGGATFRLTQQSIHGDLAYICWTAETADNRYELATDTFLVKDGKIAAQSFAARVVPKA